MAYIIEGYYSREYGWEEVCSEDSRAEARDRLREYNENEPEYRHRMRRVNDHARRSNEAIESELCRMSSIFGKDDEDEGRTGAPDDSRFGAS